MEYILERYGDGRLAPPVGSSERAGYLQWLHFAESTAFPPLGIVVWLTRYRDDAQHQSDLLEDARGRAAAGLDLLERELGGKPYLVGDAFTAADIMLGFTAGRRPSGGNSRRPPPEPLRLPGPAASATPRSRGRSRSTDASRPCG